MACDRKRVQRRRLCAGDLRHLITIETRTIAAPSLGAAVPSENFVKVKNVYAAIETFKGTRRFRGVNIDDRATHLFFIRFDAALKDLETGNHFIRFDGRQFRIFEITNDQEDRAFLIVQASDRGDEEKDAADA